MFENIINFFKGLKKSNKQSESSKESAKERLHLVLMQDRANVSADFLDLMKQEIIEVIKKYINIDENEIDVRLANKTNDDGTTGAPALYANIPIVSIKNEAKEIKNEEKNDKVENKVENKVEDTQVDAKNDESKISDDKEEQQHDKTEDKVENNEDNSNVV